jgi:hypothetical protein
MEKIVSHDRGFDPLDQRLEHFHSATTPIDPRAPMRAKISFRRYSGR